MGNKTLKTVGIYSGSFNPPHLGHVFTAVSVLASGLVDEILVCPAFKHPFGKELVDLRHRRYMAALAFGTMFDVHVSGVEEQNTSGYTCDLIDLLNEEWADDYYFSVKPRLIIGSDQLGSLDKWHKIEALIQMAPPIIVGRTGYTTNCVLDEPELINKLLCENASFLTEIEIPGISSTEVRSRLRNGTNASQLVPANVLEYIRENDLYKK